MNKSTGDTGNGRWIAAGTTIVATTIDLIYGVEASLIVPLVFGPFVASALASVRDTATVAVVATLFGVLLGWTDRTIGTSPHAVRVASVAIGQDEGSRRAHSAIVDASTGCTDERGARHRR